MVGAHAPYSEPRGLLVRNSVQPVLKPLDSLPPAPCGPFHIVYVCSAGFRLSLTLGRDGVSAIRMTSRAIRRTLEGLCSLIAGGYDAGGCAVPMGDRHLVHAPRPIVGAVPCFEFIAPYLCMIVTASWRYLFSYASCRCALYLSGSIVDIHCGNAALCATAVMGESDAFPVAPGHPKLH